MTEIAPGMMVECIDISPSGFANTIPYSIPYSISKLRLHGFYIVKSVHTHRDGSSRICLEGFPNWEEVFFVSSNKVTHMGFFLSRFKPFIGDKEIEKEKFEELKPLMIPDYLVRLARG